MARLPNLLVPLKQANPDRPSRKWAVYYRKVVLRPRDPKRPNAGMVKEMTTTRAFFPDEKSARLFISEKKAEADELGADALVLTDALKREAVECLEKLRAFIGRDGKPPTLTDAVNVYIREERICESDKRVGQAIVECIKAKRGEGKSLRYLQQMEIMLRKFSDRFGSRPLGSVKDYEIERWLAEQSKRGNDGKGLAPTTRNNLLTYVVAFYSWCVEAGLTALNPAKGIKCLRLRRHDDDDSQLGRLLSPDQLRLILAESPDDLLPTVTLLAFGGLRVAEMARLRWKHLQKDSTVLFLNRGITKTDEGRVTPLPKAVAKYLEKQRPEGREDDFIFKGGQADDATNLSPDDEARRDLNRVSWLDKRLNALKRKVRAHFPWPNNALRASALSYRAQVTGSTDRTAEEMGNSKKILKRSYQELTTPQDAQEWFEIDPAYLSRWSAEQVANYIKGKAEGLRLAKRLMKEQAEKEEAEEHPDDLPLDDEPDCGGIRDTSRDPR